MRGRSQIAAVAGVVIAAISLGGAIPAEAGAVPPQAVAARRLGSVREYSLPEPTDVYPYDIASGPDGNMWFTEFLGHQVARITPGGFISEFPLGGVVSTEPEFITSGPAGSLWVNDVDGTVHRITTRGHDVNQYPTGLRGGITHGPDGNLWIAAGSTIGRLTPGGKLTRFPLPGAAALRITTGPDGNLWFTDPVDFFTTGRIGRITPAGVITEFPVPANIDGHTVPWDITAGPDGRLWFTDQFDRVGRISTDGHIKMFSVGPDGSAPSVPSGITTGPDGNLWFTVVETASIVRMSPTGTLTTFRLPAPYAGPAFITPDRASRLWFTEPGRDHPANRIGSIEACGAGSCQG